jgi:hypothetical protein
MTLSIMALSINDNRLSSIECNYSVSCFFILMLSVIMLRVLMLNVIKLIVVEHCHNCVCAIFCLPLLVVQLEPLILGL